MNDSNSVFVIYGRNKQLYEYIQSLLRAFGLTPLLWDEARAQAQEQLHNPIVYTLDIVKQALTQSNVMLAILSPDEIVTLKKIHQNASERDPADLFPAEQARPNVIFEIGLALGLAKANQKIYILLCNNCRLMSDFAGVDYISLDYNDFTKFITSLRSCLKTNGLIIDQTAYANAMEVPRPFFPAKPYLYDQHDVMDGIALSLKQRGDYLHYINKIMDAKTVRVMGVSQEFIARHIIWCLENGGEALNRFKGIEFKLLISGNKTYTNFIDRFEKQRPRSLFSCNIERVLKLAKLKQSTNCDNFNIGMHLYANSATMIVIDNIMWITPYTNKDGNQSPTFVLEEKENPIVYLSYISMFDALWKESVLVKPNYNKRKLKSALTNRRKELKV